MKIREKIEEEEKISLLNDWLMSIKIISNLIFD